MRVYGYCRVSTQMQDLERQEKLINEFCSVRGYSLEGIISEKVSGSVGGSDRESLVRLMGLTKEDCDVVIFSELSRLTREDEIENVVIYVKQIKANGIDVIFLDEPNVIYRSDEPFSLIQLITLIVKAQGASDERKKIRDRMDSGKKLKLVDNPYMVVGNMVPFCFKAIKNKDYILGKTPKSLLIEDSKEINAFIHCCEMVINGSSCQMVADYLNLNGFQHRRFGKVLDWKANEVNMLLHNRLYIGERKVGDVVVNIRPIISMEMYEKVSEMLSRHRCIIGKEVHYNPLRGLFYCGDCGIVMGIVKSKKGRLVYICNSMWYRYRSDIECNCGNVQYDLVIDAVKGSVLSRYGYEGKSSNVMDVEVTKKEIMNAQMRMAELIEERKKFKGDIAKVEEQMVVISDSFVLKILDSKIADLRSSIKKIEDDLRKLERQVGKMTSSMGDLGIKKEMNERDLGELFHKVIKRIEWFIPKRKKKGDGTLKIEFIDGFVEEISIKRG